VCSYYHLVPLVCCYCSVGICQTRQITLAPCSLSTLLTLVCFLIFYRSTGKHLALLTNVVSGFISFSEAPCLAWKCGTRRSDSPVRAL
jgi:hypothetical protein